MTGKRRGKHDATPRPDVCLVKFEELKWLELYLTALIYHYGG